MINLLVAISLLFTGTASQYAPGVMERVIETRQAGLTAYDLPQDLSGYTVFLAVEDCRLVGTPVLIQPLSGPIEQGIITDCSGHAETSNWMLWNNIVCEVDYETAMRWNTVGKGIHVFIYLTRVGERQMK